MEMHMSTYLNGHYQRCNALLQRLIRTVLFPVNAFQSRTSRARRSSVLPFSCYSAVQLE